MFSASSDRTASGRAAPSPTCQPRRRAAPPRAAASPPWRARSCRRSRRRSSSRRRPRSRTSSRRSRARRMRSSSNGCRQADPPTTPTTTTRCRRRRLARPFSLSFPSSSRGFAPTIERAASVWGVERGARASKVPASAASKVHASGERRVCAGGGSYQRERRACRSPPSRARVRVPACVIPPTRPPAPAGGRLPRRRHGARRDLAREAARHGLPTGAI